MDDFGNELPALTRQQINDVLTRGASAWPQSKELSKTRQELGELKQQLADLLEFFTAMKGAFKVLNWLGKLARPMAAIVALGVALAAAWNAVRGIYPK
jgi:succinate dehydrogenase/fumarate reductase flavoprotein subunit